MKTRDPLRRIIVCLLAVVLPATALAENEIGFIEKFALAPDRAKVLGELVPGTDDYYFFHALHYQNVGDAAKLADILAQWGTRFPGENQRRRIILNRDALLGYDAAPQKTLAYLKERLGLQFNHVQEARDKKPDLPTTLDPAQVARDVFERDSLTHDRGLGSFSEAALEALVKSGAPLDAQQRRALLSRLSRPDVQGLTELVALDLKSKESRGFGEFGIHRGLLPTQLEALARDVPGLATQQAFVFAKLRKFAPSPDVDVDVDAGEREAWLTRVWDYVRSLPPSFNTLKARTLFMRLDHDRKQGVYDQARFLEYLKLPRNLQYVNPKWIERIRETQPLCDLGADLSEGFGYHSQVGDDEPLVRDYFLNILQREAARKPGDIGLGMLTPYVEYVRDTWLKPVLAEALITSGQGNPEQWASLITPAEFQRLKDRVDIEFPATNSRVFRPAAQGRAGDDVQFDVVLKNTPKLIVKIYELNALNFFLTQRRQLNTDVNLDGLVANSEQTHSFEGGPFRRTRQTFTFPELKGRRGAWIIEFIGGGRSSRALVRTGQWQVIQKTGPSGDILTVVDEQGDPVEEAVAWLDGRKFVRNEKLGGIVVPFTTQAGPKQVIVADPQGTFATLAQFDHHPEAYVLDARFHIEREQLLARRQATLAVRVALMLGDARLDPALLTEPRLTITSTTLDGISTVREVEALKLGAGGVVTHELSVPERLAQLHVSLSAKVDMVSAGGKKQDISASHSWTVNGIDRTDFVSDGHLAKFGESHVFELLGRNGEPLANQQVVFTFKHRDFARTQSVPLRTDDRGRIGLGSLPGIAGITARIPSGRQGAWETETYARTWSGELHARVGERVRVPLGIVQQEISLLLTTAGTFITDESVRVTREGGFAVIEGLVAGDYALRLRGENRDVLIKVSGGKPSHGWYLGSARNLQATSDAPLHILDVVVAPDVVTVKLAHASKFTRVHVAASRFDPGQGMFGSFGGFARFGGSSGTPARLPNLYAAGREIGDEYRYILERRYQKMFPGNMLARPGLLLNPWERRATDVQELAQQAGEDPAATAGERAAAMNRAAAEQDKQKSAGPGAVAAEVNLDFLGTASPATYNLVPNEDGVVRIDRKLLGDRQHLQVYAEDLTQAVWRTVALPEVPTPFADLRLARNLDPSKAFTQREEITVVDSGRTFTLADVLTSDVETYDSLGSVYALLKTMKDDATLTEFAWVVEWPKLKEEEKLARYSEYACHELNLFLSKKDAVFFDKVVRPHLANKKDKTFMDDFLLGNDLGPYLEPWAYGRLNIVERVLLALRAPGTAANTARHVRELWELVPPDPDAEERFFETALVGRELQADGKGERLQAFKQEKGRALDGLVALGGVAGAGGGYGGRAAAAPPAPMAAASKPGDAANGSQLRSGLAAEQLREAGGKQQEELRRDAAPEDKDIAGGQGQGDAKRLKKSVAENERPAEWGEAKPMADEGFFAADDAAEARGVVRAYYRRLGATKEWAENNYYRRPIGEQDARLVTVNAFWRDYASWVAGGAKGAFVSPHVAETSRSFTEMMLALAVLDLPFDPPQHVEKAEGGQFQFTAGGPVIVFHKEIKPAGAAKPEQGQLLVSQSFFRQGDRYRQQGNEKTEKYVTGEFLAGAVYGANVVVTNPTSSPVKAEVLLQIPQAAIPVHGSRATDSLRVRIDPYTTKTFEYFFYFPEPRNGAARFVHYPVHVTVAGADVASARPFEFNVVGQFTQFDKASWDYVSQYGTDADVFAFLEQNNVAAISLERIAWRCRQSADFFRRLIGVLRERHAWNDVIYSYAVAHNDTAALREYLWHRDEFLDGCGPFLSSRLLTIDPVARRGYEHLEYSPVVNQRMHRLGSERRIANSAVLAQYQQLLWILAYKPQVDAVDGMSLTYHLFLQDRVEEAITRFRGVDPAALPTKMQHDYFRCYAEFYDGNLAAARGLAAKYVGYPVVRWRNLFAEVASQLDEIEGKAVKKSDADGQGRDGQQAALAATEPTFDFKVESKSLSLTWRNLGEVTINYYLMDPEFAFSSSPFVTAEASRFSIVKPTRSVRLPLPAGKDALDVQLPAEFAKANVLVEVVAAGRRRAQPYHASSLTLTVSENYGRLEVHDVVSGRPVSKAYVKVYARLGNGAVRFFKDGYTDLRGRFDYASLNAPENVQPVPLNAEAAPGNGLDYQMLKPAELSAVNKLAILILSEANGAAVREVDPPSN